MSDLWLVIPNWFGADGFQHYRDREPRWIKVYTRLLGKDEYRALSGHCRGVLHGLWLEYASTDGQLRVSSSSLSSRLGVRVSSRQLEALSDAGFIEFSASKPLALRYQNASLEKEKEKETPKPPLGKPVDKSGAAVRRIEKLIRNGVLATPEHLESELRHAGLNGEAAGRLERLLADRVPSGVEVRDGS